MYDFQHLPRQIGLVENQFAPFRVWGKQIDFIVNEFKIMIEEIKFKTVSKRNIFYYLHIKY
jgi:hypothetical protein